MSTASRSPTTVTCEYSECDSTGEVWEFRDGRFCSTFCHEKHEREEKARQVLQTIDRDHRLCSTCYRWIKEVERPPERWGLNSAVTGYQYRTPDAEEVWKDSRGRQGIGIGCTCGNCVHSHRDPDMQGRHLMVAANRFLELLDDLRDEGKIDVRVDRRQLFQAAIDVGAIRPALEVAIRR